MCRLSDSDKVRKVSEYGQHSSGALKWNDGQGDFIKPISCRLYPIRVAEMSNGLRALKLHRWDICRDAYIKGQREGIRVYQFLKAPIIHFFGEEFYEALEAAAKKIGPCPSSPKRDQ